jgi:signal transduction histidine kinase
LNVLFIEDDRLDSTVIQRLVEPDRFPHDVIIAASLQEANDLLKRLSFDVIISDFQLVDGTGFEVFHLAGGIPVIFVTRLGSEEIAVQAMKSGAYDYLVRDEQGNYLRMLTIILEGLNKRKQADEAMQLVRQQTHELELETERARLLSEFVTDISHDLRTPLSIIHTSLDLLMRYTDRMTMKLEQEQQLSDYRHYIERLYEYGDKVKTWQGAVERIIIRMMDMVRLNNAARFTFLTVDLCPVINDVVLRFQRQAEQKRLTLTHHNAGEVLPVAIVDGEFDNLLVYLLENSLSFTNQGGEITVQTYRQENSAVLEVTDTGIGIPEDALPYIFERFYRVDKSRPIQSGSNGMGLAICKRLVEIHRARIEVFSKVNEGSTFRVIFPLTQALSVT